MLKTRVLVSTLPAVFAGGLLLAACGTEAEPEAPAAEEEQEYNEADLEFVRGMIPHHEQAVDMSELAEDRAGEEVRSLAEEIEAAQQPEIDQMLAFLEEWQEEPGGEAAEEDDHSMHGMMTEEQMADLSAAEGEDFDSMFLTMMIEHHEGAVMMSEAVLEDGVNTEVGDLAQGILEVQEAEIELMNEMLGHEPADDGDHEADDH